jgi:hypothetical protein
VGLARLFDRHRELLPLGVSSRPTCFMLLGYYLARFKLARVFVIPLDMGNTSPLQSFSSNSTSIMLYLYHEMEVDYLVVE